MPKRGGTPKNRGPAMSTIRKPVGWLPPTGKKPLTIMAPDKGRPSGGFKYKPNTTGRQLQIQPDKGRPDRGAGWLGKEIMMARHKGVKPSTARRRQIQRTKRKWTRPHPFKSMHRSDGKRPALDVLGEAQKGRRQ